MKVYNNFTEAYVDILKDVYVFPEFISSPRGMKVKEILGYQFKILNPMHRMPYTPGRDASIHYMIAELLWYLTGNNSTNWISNYATFWSKISDDGKTANSAYGARIFKHHSYQGAEEGSLTQWEYIKNELKQDPASRRAVIHIRMPQDSRNANLDVPCTLSLQFFLRSDAIHMVASMRSSDIILGLVYDVPAFTIFQELLAVQLTKELGRPIGLGTYTHLSASLHIYEKHFKMAEKILEEDKKQDYLKFVEMPQMPSDPPLVLLTRVEEDIRKSLREEMLLNVLSQSGLTDDYWIDWSKILASHRAIKLNNLELSNKLLLSTSFKGYRHFIKS